MNSVELYKILERYFPKNLDLMRHLSINACWEYFIMENSTNEEDPKLHYFLIKENENSLVMTENKPEIKPDLILYFTEEAILNLIDGNPSAEEYYTRYKDIMDNPRPPIELDNKINKSRLKLWQIGYKNWQKDFNF